MKELIAITIILACALQLTLAFTGDDKFIRKYAMMKVYESCFGTEVVKEIRKEMKIASAKCMGYHHHQPEQQTTQEPPQTHKTNQKNHLQISLHKIDGNVEETNNIQTNQLGIHAHDTHVVHPEALTLHGPLQHHLSQNNHHANHQNLQDSPVHHVETTTKPPSLDLQKLQEAIMSGYNKHLAQNSALQASFMQQQTGTQQHMRPYYQQQVAPAPYTTPVTYQQPFYQQPFYQQSQPFYNPVPPQPQYYNPYYQPPMAQPYQQPYFRTNRASRHLGVKGQLETLTAQMAGRVNNVTCVMQELGYLDSSLEPDYMRMLDRISRLPVHEELKRDMAEGVDFCRKFSECVPDDSKDKLVRELVRPMFFFRCYKHKKLEACIMKDVRERYVMSDAMAEDNLTGNEARSAKGIPSENMATAIYEFLFGGDTQAVLETMF